MTNNNRKGNFILGTLIGGLAGGIAALLMAPQSGTETQHLILEKRDQLSQEAKKKVDDGKKFIDEKTDDARTLVADWLEAGSDLLEAKSKEIKLEKVPQAK
jgi:gas vesicle protein